MKYEFLSKNQTPSQIYKPAKMGLLTWIMIFILLITLVAFGGIFYYQKRLNEQINVLSESVKNEKKKLEAGSINEMIDFSQRIKIGKEILLNHVITSTVFNFLEENTLNRVSFSNFKFSGKLVVMEGSTEDFTTLAKQIEVLRANSFIKTAEFSNFSLSSDGSVSFNVSLSFDDSIFKSDQF